MGFVVIHSELLSAQSCTNSVDWVYELYSYSEKYRLSFYSSQKIVIHPKKTTLEQKYNA
jgi:hypothetical protein